MLTERVGLQEKLNLAADIGNFCKARLAHHPLEEHAAGNLHPYRIGIQPFAVLPFIGGEDLRRERIAPEVVGVGDAALAQLRQLGAPLGDQMIVVRLGSGVFGRVRKPSSTRSRSQRPRQLLRGR